MAVQNSFTSVQC